MRQAFKVAFLTALLLVSSSIAIEKSVTAKDEDSASLKEKGISPCMKACEAQGDDPLDCESTCVLTAEATTPNAISLACR